MNNAEFKTRKLLEEFVLPLLKEGKYVFDIQELPDDAGYKVQWTEHKTYTGYDGQVFPDEIWFTKEGEMMLVQDIEPEHCRNILRLLLRNRREEQVAMERFTHQLLAAIDDEIQAEEVADDNPGDDKPILH